MHLLEAEVKPSLSRAKPPRLPLAILAIALLPLQITIAAPTRDDVLAWLEEFRYAHDGLTTNTIIAIEHFDVLKPFVVPGFFEAMQFPEVAIEIEQAYRFEAPAIYQKATLEGGDSATLGANGALEGYAAGMPFSHARIAAGLPSEAGLMVAWNHIHRWQYYGYKSPEMRISLVRPNTGGERKVLSPGLEGGGIVDRFITTSYHRVYLSHLAMLPGQAYRIDLDDADRFLWKEFFEFFEPFDVKGTKFVIERAFADLDDQVNSYLPSQRRVRRLSAKERADSFMGTDFTFDDFAVFSGRVFDFKWTYLGQKSILFVANSKHENAKFYGPSSLIPKDRWQVRRCYVVELTPVWKDHPYASRLMFIDRENFEAAFAAIFDHNGDLWKSLYTVVQAPQDNTGNDAIVGKSVVSWRASIAFDHKNNRGSVGIGEPVAHPTMNASKVRQTFDVSNLTSGR
tara:strand:+ start:905 stop:2269 length:1365 start_codon:yes stop_codon:yes gene_type:complete